MYLLGNAAFAFSQGPTTVTLKIPPDFRSFQVVKLPESTFNQSSQRHLLDVEYDYRSKSIEELAEFELQAWFIRLATPLSTTDINADAFNRALRVAGRRSPPNDDEPVPELVTANGRQWLHLDGTDSHFGGSVGESYGTLIDPNIAFFVIASYWENIRKDPAWFESRRDLLRMVVTTWSSPLNIRPRTFRSRVWPSICLPALIVLFNSQSRTAPTPIWSRTMRLVTLLIISLGLSACATDYVSQLSEPNYGVRGVHLSPGDIDPALLMDGTYASKQMNGFYGSRYSGPFCLTDSRCSPQALQSSSGWNP